MKTTQRLLTLAQFSFFGLMATLIYWIVLVPHTPNYPTAAMLVIGVIPLLFPMRGILHGKPYTLAWNSFLMLFYFSHSVGELYSGSENWLFPALELLFSSSCFVCSIIFIKLNAKLQTESHK